MGLFSFFNRKNGNGNEFNNPSTAQERPDVAEELFIAKETASGDNDTDTVDKNGNDSGINLLFQFLERNHESRGYDDALVNPDNSHLEQNVEALKNEFERTVKKVKTFYEDFITEINFHINSRSRSGLVDTVEELNMKKTIAESHIKKVLEIESDAKNNRGDSQGILISYTRGFKNGLAAISHHNILKRKF